MSTQPDPFAAYGGKATPAPPAAVGDPFAAYGGKATPPAPPKPQPAQDAISAALGPKAGEGGYQMHDSTGIPHNIGYHQVHKALDDGFLFADKPTLQQYARDHAADPLDESRVDQWIDKHPILSGLIQGPIGFAREATKTMTAFDRTPTTRGETEAQLFAATPNKGIREDIGGAAEFGAEFMTGQELFSLLGKTGAGMTMAQKLKTVTRLQDLIEAVPMIGKVLKIGSSAVKAGTIGAGQTFAKTGGDLPAAATSGVLTGLAGPVAETIGAAGSAINTMFKGPAEAEAAAVAARQAAAAGNVAEATRAAEASRAQYAEEARAAIRPHLEATNAARVRPEQEVLMNQPSSEENVLMNQPGGEPAVPTGRRVTTPALKTGTMARPTETPPVNIDHVLNQTQDFTGAADHLTAINDEAYNEFDSATGGRFRQLNGEIAAAGSAARKGEEGAAQIYKSKLAQMDELMDSTGGQMTPEMKAAAKAGFRQSYVLRDFGDIWDRSLNGVPGASQSSQAQRGLNGKQLWTGLQRAVKMYGRAQIEGALGKGRLEALDEIAQANITDKQRAAFNGGVRTVAEELQRLEQAAKKAKLPQQERLSPWAKRGIAATLGGTAAHMAGMSPFYGMVTAETTYETTRFVMNAIKTNPKIAQNFMFALQSGARAERYGPAIATMIQKLVTDSSLEEQRQRQETKP